MRRQIPSLQALVCFEAAARHESYTRAAAALALTQGAVSRQIAALEALLGLRLFRRTQHGVCLTPAGAQYARQVAGRLDALERDTLDTMAHQGHGGALHLSAVPTFATRWLLPRLPDFTRRHPDVVVHIDTRTRPFLFSDSGFDAALYAGTPEQVAQWPGTHTTFLMAETAVPVCSPQHARTRKRWRAADLAHEPLLQQSTRPFDWRDWFEAQGVSTAQAMAGPRYELFSMLAAAATHGLGVAMIPRMLIEPELERRELVVLLDKPLSVGRAYHLIRPVTPHEKPALTAFRVWLVAQAQEGTAGAAA